MQKTTRKRKMVLGKEIVKALVVEWRDGHLQGVRGGAGPTHVQICLNKSRQVIGACSDVCQTIDK